MNITNLMVCVEIKTLLNAKDTIFVGNVYFFSKNSLSERQHSWVHIILFDLSSHIKRVVSLGF